MLPVLINKLYLWRAGWLVLLPQRSVQFTTLTCCCCWWGRCIAKIYAWLEAVESFSQALLVSFAMFLVVQNKRHHLGAQWPVTKCIPTSCQAVVLLPSYSSTWFVPSLIVQKWLFCSVFCLGVRWPQRKRTLSVMHAFIWCMQGVICGNVYAPLPLLLSLVLLFVLSHWASRRQFLRLQHNCIGRN